MGNSISSLSQILGGKKSHHFKDFLFGNNKLHYMCKETILRMIFLFFLTVEINWYLYC